MDYNKKYDYVILGGGVSGLGFAKRMAENGKSVLVLEKEDSVGGLSRTLSHEGFFLDFCAHRFHTNNKKLLEEIRSLDGLKLLTHNKRSRIYMFGRYLKYPFELESLLRAMPLTDSISAGLSFGWSLVKRQLRKSQPNLVSYKDWFTYLYGESLYKIMCRPYSAKIWHTDPALLSADWADQRFQTENILRLTMRIVKKALTLNFRSYSLEEDSLAPDGGIFYYPLKGIQEIPDALAKSSAANGAQIHCGAKVVSVSNKDKELVYERGGKRIKVKWDNLISTIPLHNFYNLQERRNSEVEKAMAGLKYMDIAFVYLFINKPRISNDHWLYFPDKDIVFNRAVEFSNWSENMCPEGKTSICFDITGFDGTGDLQMSDHELTDRVIRDCIRAGYIKEPDLIYSSKVFRVTHAYPFYDLDYRNKLNTIVNYLETDNVKLLGRTGIFKYNNSDNSIEMGFALAEAMLQKRDFSLNEYNIKHVSL